MLQGFMDWARSKIVSISISRERTIISWQEGSIVRSLGSAAVFFLSFAATVFLTSSVAIVEVPPLVYGIGL
jgi:hypothetical protein